MATTENIALANTIDKVKNYVDDPNNLYGVLRAGLLTGDLDTPFVQFVGASTMSYPVFPKNTTDLPDYSKTGGYTRVNVDYDRKEVTVSQDKGYQIGVDRLDLEDGHLTSIMIINNQVRQMEVPTLDKYRLNKLASASGVTSVEITLGTDDLLKAYDKAVETLTDNELPVSGTILYCTPSFYSALKQNDNVRRTVNVNQNDGNVNRNIVMLDDVTKIIQVPTSRMPASTLAILVQPLAVIAGIKRSYSKLIEDPEDFDGILINRRLVHDLFVLEDRNKGVYVFKTASE